MKTMYRLLFMLGLILAFPVLRTFCQVAINTNGAPPDPTAMLDVSSTNSGMLIPRVSAAARNQIPSPAAGLLIYNMDDNLFNYYNGSSWYQLGATPFASATGILSPGGGVAINASPGVLPDNSAMLDVNDPSRGILIPRVTTAAREAMISPATGLFTYKPEGNILFFFNGSQWITLCGVSTGIAGATGSQSSVGMAVSEGSALPDPSAILDISSATKGMLIPRLSSTGREALLPVTGLTIYNPTTGTIEFFNGTSWCQVDSYLSESPTAGIQIASADQIEWHWNPVARAAGYKWNIIDDFGSATDLGTNTSFLETGLTCGTSYTHYVWAYSGCGYLSPAILTQSTLPCSLCGTSITVSHQMTGGVAPVGKSVTYGIVSNIPGETSKCWISSNLGADHQADSVDDVAEESAGWYWQFNRKQGYDATFGPQFPAGAAYNNENSDWMAANDPCTLELGSTWRMPTHTEWENVNASGSWTSWNGPWTSALKLHTAGYRNFIGVYDRGSKGYYWSSIQSNPSAGWELDFGSASSVLMTETKTNCFSIRCLREVSPVGYTCGSPITVNHIAGEGVAPVDKTVTYGIVSGISGESEKCWISKNLGASQQAGAVNDATEASSGWYWQFNSKQGYKLDDDYSRTPNTVWINNIYEESDWVAANDPCVQELSCGWRIPTQTEWQNVNSAGGWSSGWLGPWGSALKLHAAGVINYNNGVMENRGWLGQYWSSARQDASYGNGLYFDSGSSYVYSYNVKSNGFPVRCLRDATILNSEPTVKTTSVSNVGETTAITGGHVTCEGGTPVTTRGICLSTSVNPTIADSHMDGGTGMGLFLSSLAELSPNTVYHVRAYATNSTGTSYGDDLSFTTSSVFPCGSSLSINHLAAGGVAPTDKMVTYGTVSNLPGEPSKCWITRNLGAANVAASFDDATEASAGWYWQFNHKQGYMYDWGYVSPSWTITYIWENSDWEAAKDPCALELGGGWRIPTGTEWSNVSEAGNWSSSGTYNSLLQIHAAGYLDNFIGNVLYRGLLGHYWSSVQTDNNGGVYFICGSGFSYTNYDYKSVASPLRCLRDIFASVTTAEVSNIVSIAAGSGGEVISDGGTEITGRGVCWGTASIPTIAGDHTSDGNGLGPFVSSITGLQPGTQYFVRAYATNGTGTSYGNEVTFTTSGFTCGATLFRNHVAGEVAPVTKTGVTYGTTTGIAGDFSKCWITRNLGADRVALAQDDASEASAGWYWQFGLKQGYKVDDYGARTPNTTWIQWPGATSDWQAENDPCTIELGSGWRIPTAAEWTNVNTTGGWTDWNGPWTSGLNLHAAGFIYHEYWGGLMNRGSAGIYWSSAHYSDGTAWYIGFSSSQCQMTSYQAGFGVTLRCLRENINE
ncbi:MAG: hypothetical protein NTW16_17160 [Bacteroidetes bacterium]|nr:hypothetical protein [Bacteroidota bacterium]